MAPGVVGWHVEAVDPVADHVDLALVLRHDHRFAHRHRFGDRRHPGVEVDLLQGHDHEARSGVKVTQRRCCHVELVTDVRRGLIGRDRSLKELRALLLVSIAQDQAADGQLDPHGQLADCVDERAIVRESPRRNQPSRSHSRAQPHWPPEPFVDQLG